MWGLREFDAFLLCRSAADLDPGQLQFDVDATWLLQDPYSPHPRDSCCLSTRLPLDANVDPGDASQVQDRVQANRRCMHAFDSGQWVTTVSFTDTGGDPTGGFLREGFATDGTTTNADGFRRHADATDVYLDTYCAPHWGVDDTRSFGGAYVQADWRATDRWLWQANRKFKPPVRAERLRVAGRMSSRPLHPLGTPWLTAGPLLPRP